MSTQTEAALDISRPLLIEPAAANATQLPYAPSLTFGQAPTIAPTALTEAAQSSLQGPRLQFEGLVQSYPPIAPDLQPSHLSQSDAGQAPVNIMQPHPDSIQPGTLYGTQQAMLAAQHAVATAQYGASQLPFPTGPIIVEQAESSFSLPLSIELQQAIAQPITQLNEALPLVSPVVLQGDDQASQDTQDTAAQKAKKERLRRSIRKKRPRDNKDPSSRKPPAPITLSVTPVLQAITEAQPMQCLGPDQNCPGQLSITAIR